MGSGMVETSVEHLTDCQRISLRGIRRRTSLEHGRSVVSVYCQQTWAFQCLQYIVGLFSPKRLHEGPLGNSESPVGQERDWEEETGEVSDVEDADVGTCAEKAVPSSTGAEPAV